MKKRLLGALLLVVGVLLIIWGYNVSQSVGGRFQQALRGTPPDQTMYLYISGAALSVVGLSLIAFSRK